MIFRRGLRSRFPYPDPGPFTLARFHFLIKFWRKSVVEQYEKVLSATIMAREPIGWVGLGSMGLPMAGRLADKGYPLLVYNRTPKPWVGKGSVTVCQSPAEVGSNCRILFIMVTDGNASRRIFNGEGGLLGTDLENRIVINMTTERPEEAISESIAVEGAGGLYFDIPVSGSVVPAQKGELLLLAGGNSLLGPLLDPILRVLGTSVKWMGSVGSGMKTKLVLNALLAAHMEALAETLLLGESMGLPANEMAQVILESPLATPFYRIKIRNILRGDYAKAFSVSLMSKDLTLLRKEAQDEGIPLPPLFADLEGTYRDLVEAGEGDKDLSVLYEHLKKKVRHRDRNWTP